MISKKELFAILDKRIKTLMDDPYIDPSSRADRLKEIKVLRNEIDSLPDDQPDLLPFEYPVKEGYEVVTRDGRKVEQVVKFNNANRPIAGIIENTGSIDTWRSDGCWEEDCKHPYDLFLRRKEKKVWVVEWPNNIRYIYSDFPVAVTDPDCNIFEATLKPVV